ncbi:MAG TPA: methyltransferase domain-containing protein [Longimicrobiaceae bacterium]|nr:methyltransferase domain-containing protein [Longimicrobiaceae bacterium]
MTEYLEREVDLADPPTASAFDELSFWASRFGRLLFDHLELRPDLAILDLGCGTGFPLFELAHAHGPSCRCVGVDLWGAGLARAAHKRRVHALRRVALVHGDGARLPFAPHCFDLVVSNLGVNNFDDAPGVLAECARVARPGARLALTTNLAGHMRELYAVLREVAAERGGPGATERLAANQSHRGSVQSLSALVRGAGFRVARVVEDSFVMRYLDGSALLRHWLTVVGFLGGWRAVAGPERERDVLAELERRLNDEAARAGGLAMTVPMLYLEAVR